MTRPGYAVHIFSNRQAEQFWYEDLTDAIRWATFCEEWGWKVEVFNKWTGKTLYQSIPLAERHPHVSQGGNTMKTLTHDFIKDLPKQHVENLSQYEECVTCGAMGRNLAKYHTCLGPRESAARNAGSTPSSKVVKTLS